MRITFYQGRQYVVFNFPENTTATVLMYPNMDTDTVRGYHFIKRDYRVHH